MRTGGDVLDFFRRNEGIGEPLGVNANWITDWYFGYRSAYNYWCAAGVSRGIVEAGWTDDGETMNLRALGIWQSTDRGWGYVPAQAAAFRDAGRLVVVDGDRGFDPSGIPPGSPVIFNYSGGWRDPDYGTPGDHTGVYLSNNGDGTVQTWEANDRANSIGEWRRDLSQVYAFCLLPEEAAPEDAGKPQKRVPVPRLAVATVRLSDAGVDFVASKEGLRTELHNDPANHCSFGIGHLVHLGACDGRDSEARFRGGWTREAVVQLFRDEDLPPREQAVRDRIRVPVYQAEFDAAVSYLFNLGAGNFDDTAFLARLNAGDYAGAAEELGTWPPRPSSGQWTDADWSKAAGLFTRREEEEALFRSEWGRFITINEEDLMAAYTVTIPPNEEVFVPVPPPQGSGGLPWTKVFVSLSAPVDTKVRAIRVQGDAPNKVTLGDDAGGDYTVTKGRDVGWEMAAGDDGVIVQNKGKAIVTALVEASAG